MKRWSAVWVLGLATLAGPAFGQMQQAQPGALNYVEGQASVEGHEVHPRSVGREVLAKDQYLATADGRAELLLTPGVFLRLDKNSTVRMVSPDLTHTEVELTQGRASVEVDHIIPQNTLLVDMKGAQTQLLQNGLYVFDQANGSIRTFDGKAQVFSSLTPQENEKAVEVKGGHQYTLGTTKTIKFDRDQAENRDELYRWSGVRSEYLEQGSAALAQSYEGQEYTPGWYWDPMMYNYAWLGAGPYWSPFGYGFYSPWYWGGGFYGGGYGYGRRGGGPYHGGYGWHGYSRGGSAGGGFHGAPGGGFHGGGGGGFHGGGGGGHAGGGHR